MKKKVEGRKKFLLGEVQELHDNCSFSIRNLILLLTFGLVLLTLGDILSLISETIWTKSFIRFPSMVAYIIADLLIASAVVTFIVRCYKNLGSALIFVEAFTLGCLFISYIWPWLIEGQIHINSFGEAYAAFIMLLDIITLSGVIVLSASISIQKSSGLFKLIKIGLLLFSLCNMAQHMVISYDDVYTDIVFKIMRLVSLIVTVIGIQASNKGNQRPAGNIYVEPVNMSVEKKALAMLLLTIAFASHEIYLGEKNIILNMVSGGIILCYYIVAVFMQNAVKEEELRVKQIKLEDSLRLLKPIQLTDLERLADIDLLTKLYNRRFFMHKLEQEIGELRVKQKLAVVMLNINRFKALNDTYGREAGNAVLIEMAVRINRWNTFNATVARYGGDEFVIALTGDYARVHIEKYISMLIDEIEQPFLIGGRKLRVLVSFGIAICPKYTRNGTNLLKHAHIAMCYALSASVKYAFYDKALRAYEQRQEDVKSLLGRANKKKKFELFYQPQFRLSDKRLIGAEVLLRWSAGPYGYISPEEFIPVAEKMGITKDIGAWTMRKAFVQINKWNEKYGLQLKAGINVSAKQLMDEGFVDILNDNIKSCKINPKWIDLDITESAAIQDERKMGGIFRYLKDRGITVSFDDFGKDHSPLGFLQRYSFSRIKLDKSLTGNVCSDKNDRRIITAIVAVAKSMDIRIMAEGVETIKQLDILSQLGCDEAQGYLLGRPVPAKRFEDRYIKPFSQKLSSSKKSKKLRGSSARRRTTA